MKNLLLSIFIITGFTACKSDVKPDTAVRDIQLLNDSTTYQNTVLSDTPLATKTAIVPAAVLDKPRVIIIRNEKSIPAKTTAITPVYTQPAAVPPVATAPIATSESTTGNSQADTATSGNRSVAVTPEVAKKKGWSKAAQGAAIGGVTGAIGGAVISKKKGLGAVVGGVVGAAGGYIIGKGMDKKENRLVIE